jgi:hypothetical protein
MAVGDVVISGGLAFFLDLGKSHERICGGPLCFVREYADGGGTLLLLIVVGRNALPHVAGGSLSSEV